ncbi:MAG: AMP-binding protein [Bacteroidetes bacterium]|uniref:AMP-binding protein n=1 Tax=Candidatus Cryptobacteroides avistercoris TaxID=2840758 RepID=A0A9D9IWT5_9BACT|nr:AMP-binding protein [Candidatus Cryptobacteroides avistercoris]
MDRKEIFKNNFESSFTWIEGFMRNVRRYGDQTALSCPPGGLKYSYRELNSEVNRLACALQDKGVRKGDVVMYMLHNSVQFVLCYIAPQKLGAVNCPVNYYLSAGELALNIEDSRPKVFVYESNFADTVEAALRLSSFRPEVILATGGSAPEGHTDFNDFLSRGSDREPVPDEQLNIYDECTRLYTSGTTSRPKGVPLYSINEVLSAHDVIMHFPMTHGDKTMNMTPWFHRGGLHSGGPCPTLYVGGEVVVMREFNAGLTLQYTQDYGINFLIGVPAVLNLLCRVQEQNGADLSSLKGIVTMGAPLDKESCIRFMQVLTPKIFNGYGTTETFWNTFLRPADLPEHAGSCGRACTDDDVRVVKVHPDRFAEPDETVKKDNAEIGEVIIASPAKSGMHYMGNDELTGQRFHNGFFYTGDLAVWDKDSYVTIVTRKDDMIVSSGENIYPAQVENVLMEHPDVAEACVVGLPDKLRDQVTVAYVVSKNSSLTVKDLVHFVNNHQMLAAYKRPKFYRICDSLPHTPTGKLQRAVVREQALQDFAMGLLHR